LTPNEITGLLRAWSGGDRAALESLVPLVDQELRRIARRCLEKERHDVTLQTTALVNEAYLRLIDVKQVNWQDRAHFFAICAQIMRRILVDHARARQSAKRGGGVQSLPLDEALAACGEQAAGVVAIDDALEALAKMDPRKGQVVELRFFGGLSVEETAAVLHISPESVMRDWRLAKVWLLRELSREVHGGRGKGAAN
jgi:RNA polymerase sigma-70 factor, ECF subfamily